MQFVEQGQLLCAMVDDEGGSGGNASAGKVVTASDNEPMVYLEETRGDFRISYYHEIPFFGKAKADPSFFGGIKVSYGGKEYKATKIKVNKKKGLIRITGLDTSDKNELIKFKVAHKRAAFLFYDKEIIIRAKIIIDIIEKNLRKI